MQVVHRGARMFDVAANLLEHLSQHSSEGRHGEYKYLQTHKFCQFWAPCLFLGAKAFYPLCLPTVSNIAHQVLLEV